MRVFWILLSLIIAGSGIAVFMPEGDRSGADLLTTSAAAPADQTRSQSDMPQMAEMPEMQEMTEMPEMLGTDGARDTIDETATAADAIETQAPVETADAIESTEQDIPELTADDIASQLTETDAAPTIETADAKEAAPSTEETTDASSGWAALAEKAETDATDEAAAELASEMESDADAKEESNEAPAALTIARNEDGSLSIGEGKYTINGSGTKENPYVIPWEYFVSIQEHYNPREGKKAIPSHIAMFDGTYVSISGYLQFPLATPEPTECLVMLNQWDGCCIGVPPTPYDAIEVSLAEPASRTEKFAVEGRIVGKLKIDPYLVGNWLIGLYLINDASVDVSGSRTAEELYGNTPSQLIPPAE